MLASLAIATSVNPLLMVVGIVMIAVAYPINKFYRKAFARLRKLQKDGKVSVTSGIPI